MNIVPENTSGVYASDDRDKMDIDFIYNNLKTLYWALNLTRENLVGRMMNSMCFGVFIGERQIGFARVITDYFSFAYLADVFIDENYRGRGLGKWLVNMILAHPDLQGLRRIMLATRDAHKLYEQLGFIAMPNPDRYMVYNPQPNKNK